MLLPAIPVPCNQVHILSRGQDLHVAAGTTFHLPCKVIFRVDLDAGVEEDTDDDHGGDAEIGDDADADD